MIFFDVGAHEGQTLEEVVKCDFDQIYAFEPAVREFFVLHNSFAHYDNVSLVNAGLLDEECELALFGENSNMGASIFQDKIDVEDYSSIATFLDVAKILEGFNEDSIIMKLNCEGSEVRIMNRLIDTGQMSKIHNVMIDFDVRKIPSQEKSEHQLLQRFKEINFTSYCLAEDVMVGVTHQDRIKSWLTSVFCR